MSGLEDANPHFKALEQFSTVLELGLVLEQNKKITFIEILDVSKKFMKSIYFWYFFGFFNIFYEKK